MRGKHAASANKRRAEAMAEAVKVQQEQYADLKAKAKLADSRAAECDAAKAEVARLRDLLDAGTSDDLEAERSTYARDRDQARADVASLLEILKRTTAKHIDDYALAAGVARRYGMTDLAGNLDQMERRLRRLYRSPSRMQGVLTNHKARQENTHPAEGHKLMRAYQDLLSILGPVDPLMMAEFWFEACMATYRASKEKGWDPGNGQDLDTYFSRILGYDSEHAEAASE